jgi:hypothetical protein
MSQGIIRAIDESPLLNLLFDCAKALPGVALRGANAILEGAAELGTGAVAFAKGTTAMGSSIFGGQNGPEVSPVRTPEISAPALTQAHSVDPSELCTFSAPTFGGCGSRGVSGLGM